MTPQEETEKLFELQKIDSKIFVLRKEIEALPEKWRLKELSSDCEGKRKILDEKQEKLRDMMQAQHKLDQEIETLSIKVKEEEGKLFNGTIMNPKELQGVQAEVLHLRKRTDELETQDLELMESIDSLNEELEGAKRILRDVEDEENSNRKKHDEELAQKEDEISLLEGEKDSLKEKIDKELVEEYEQLLKTRGGVAVVRIEQGKNCGGCHIQFTGSQIDRIQHEEGIFRCEHCRRILVK
ncbi:MAG: hypothetical protein PHP64_01305 [Actinomycetota bacterium]|nr:hypothetical protein [Actinomycetota bacterium]